MSFDRFRAALAAVFLGLAPLMASAASSPMRPAVLIVATFEFGDPRARGSIGEARRWVVRDGLTRTLAVPGLSSPLFCDRSGAECLIITGMGKANAAVSMLVAGTAPALDLRRTFVVLAGIAGTSPSAGSVGSVAWARWVVDGGIANEIDPREPGAPHGFSRSRLGCDGRPWCGNAWRTNSEVFAIDPGLERWAFATSRNVVLADSASVRAHRARYVGSAYGQRPPVVEACDVDADDTYWAGAIMSRFASWWVKEWTAGSGRYCMSSMEDSGFMTSIARLTAMHRIAPRHTLVLRAASDYDQQYRGSTPQAALAGIEHTGGLDLALENAYRVGEPVVRALSAGEGPR
jgi:purine nucleoside permease